MTRRDAFRTAALTAASYNRVLGANDRIGLGVIGTGGRASMLLVAPPRMNSRIRECP